MNESDLINIVEKYYQQYQTHRKNPEHRTVYKTNNQQNLSFCSNENNEIGQSSNQEYKCVSNAINTYKQSTNTKQSKYKLRGSHYQNNGQMSYEEKYRKILELLKCQNQHEAELKILKHSQNEKFIKRLKQMIGLCEKTDRNQEKQITLSRCWKFIKSVVQEAYRQKKNNQNI